MLREDAGWKDSAATISALTKDVTEFMDGLGLRGAAPPQALTVAYHSACSMQHGQQIRREPKALLAAASFAVKEVPEGPFCCGPAGPSKLPPAAHASHPPRPSVPTPRTQTRADTEGDIEMESQLL